MSDSFPIGQAVKMKGVVGRIVEREGGILHMATPHNTLIKSGFIWINPICDESDKEAMDLLREYERDAAFICDEVYFDKLSEFRKFPPETNYQY